MALSAEVSMTAQAVPSTDRIAPASAMSQTSKKSTGTVKSKKSGSKGRSKSPGKAASAKSKPSSSRSKSSRKGGPIGLEGAVDILSPVAMENLSYIAHEAQGALTLRGFPWKGGPKKKKGKGGKKKKK